jgi:3-deoxy-D-manno-octulosonate 8-phosphate phosphatase (KDO 8-P phosphatase)
MSDLVARASRIKLLLMDVDGVLTDGTYSHVEVAPGILSEVKFFDSQDGIALQWAHQYGLQTGLISGRVSAATKERARSSKMKYDYQGFTEKIPIWDEILQDSGLTAEQVAFVGDDLTDLVLLRRAGFGVAVANARPEVKAAAHYVTQTRGGEGALREVVELIFQAQGRWSEILKRYEA